MIYIWQKNPYIAIFVIIVASCILGCQSVLPEQDTQSEALQPTPTQILTVDSEKILYTTVLEDFSRTVGLIDANKLSRTPTFLNQNLGNVRNPVWSNSHDYILYAKQEDEDIYSFSLVDANGDNPRQITNPFPFEAAVNVAWSFNDNYIAFITSPDRYAVSTHRLMLAAIEASENSINQVMSDGVWQYAWSPVDDRLAVIKWGSEAESGLYLIKSDGSQAGFFPASEFFPLENPTLINLAWSANGQQIAVSNLPNESTEIKEIYFINLDTRVLEQFTNQQENLIRRSISCLNWSPNGQTISFISDYESANGQTRQGALITVDIDSKKEIQLANHVVAWACPVWSSNGKQLAFVAINNPSNVNGDLYTADVDEYIIRRLTNDSLAKNDLSW